VYTRREATDWFARVDVLHGKMWDEFIALREWQVDEHASLHAADDAADALVQLEAALDTLLRRDLHALHAQLYGGASVAAFDSVAFETTARAACALIATARDRALCVVAAFKRARTKAWDAQLDIPALFGALRESRLA
jgi:hypothetical protein